MQNIHSCLQLWTEQKTQNQLSAQPIKQRIDRSTCATAPKIQGISFKKENHSEYSYKKRLSVNCLVLDSLLTPAKIELFPTMILHVISPASLLAIIILMLLTNGIIAKIGHTRSVVKSGLAAALWFIRPRLFTCTEFSERIHKPKSI